MQSTHTGAHGQLASESTNGDSQRRRKNADTEATSAELPHTAQACARRDNTPATCSAHGIAVHSMCEAVCVSAACTSATARCRARLHSQPSDAHLAKRHRSVIGLKLPCRSLASSCARNGGWPRPHGSLDCSLPRGVRKFIAAKHGRVARSNGTEAAADH